MTSLGLVARTCAASLLLSAPAPLLAASHDAGVVLQCLPQQPAGLCQSLAEALSAAQGTRSVTTVQSFDDLQALPHLAVRFVTLRQSEHILAGHLSWTLADGRTGQGPDLELTVVHAPLSAVGFADYARELVTLSNLPM